MSNRSIGADSWWTVKQFADEFGYHPEYVRQLIRDGQLDAVKVKGWRISQESVQQFISNRRASNT